MFLTISYIFFGLFILLFAISVILMFLWKIPSLVDELSGNKAKRQIKKLKEFSSNPSGFYDPYAVYRTSLSSTYLGDKEIKIEEDGDTEEDEEPEEVVTGTGLSTGNISVDELMGKLGIQMEGNETKEEPKEELKETTGALTEEETGFIGLGSTIEIPKEEAKVDISNEKTGLMSEEDTGFINEETGLISEEDTGFINEETGLMSEEDTGFINKETELKPKEDEGLKTETTKEVVKPEIEESTGFIGEESTGFINTRDTIPTIGSTSDFLSGKSLKRHRGPLKVDKLVVEEKIEEPVEKSNKASVIVLKEIGSIF